MTTITRQTGDNSTTVNLTSDGTYSIVDTTGQSDQWAVTFNCGTFTCTIESINASVLQINADMSSTGTFNLSVDEAKCGLFVSGGTFNTTTSSFIQSSTSDIISIANSTASFNADNTSITSLTITNNSIVSGSTVNTETLTLNNVTLENVILNVSDTTTISNSITLNGVNLTTNNLIFNGSGIAMSISNSTLITTDGTSASNLPSISFSGTVSISMEWTDVVSWTLSLLNSSNVDSTLNLALGKIDSSTLTIGSAANSTYNPTINLSFTSTSSFTAFNVLDRSKVNITGTTELTLGLTSTSTFGPVDNTIGSSLTNAVVSIGSNVMLNINGTITVNGTLQTINSGTINFNNNGTTNVSDCGVLGSLGGNVNFTAGTLVLNGSILLSGSDAIMTFSGNSVLNYSYTCFIAILDGASLNISGNSNLTNSSGRLCITMVNGTFSIDTTVVLFNSFTVSSGVGSNRNYLYFMDWTENIIFGGYSYTATETNYNYLNLTGNDIVPTDITNTINFTQISKWDWDTIYFWNNNVMNWNFNTTTTGVNMYFYVLDIGDSSGNGAYTGTVNFTHNGAQSYYMCGLSNYQGGTNPYGNYVTIRKGSAFNMINNADGFTFNILYNGDNEPYLYPATCLTNNGNHSVINNINNSSQTINYTPIMINNGSAYYSHYLDYIIFSALRNSGQMVFVKRANDPFSQSNAASFSVNGTRTNPFLVNTGYIMCCSGLVKTFSGVSINSGNTYTFNNAGAIYGSTYDSNTTVTGNTNKTCTNLPIQLSSTDVSDGITLSLLKSFTPEWAIRTDFYNYATTALDSLNATSPNGFYEYLLIDSSLRTPLFRYSNVATTGTDADYITVNNSNIYYGITLAPTNNTTVTLNSSSDIKFYYINGVSQTTNTYTYTGEALAIYGIIGCENLFAMVISN